MARSLRPLSLTKVYQLLEPGPVVLLTTTRGGRPNGPVIRLKSRMR